MQKCEINISTLILIFLHVSESPLYIFKLKLTFFLYIIKLIILLKQIKYVYIKRFLMQVVRWSAFRVGGDH